MSSDTPSEAVEWADEQERLQLAAYADEYRDLHEEADRRAELGEALAPTQPEQAVAGEPVSNGHVQAPVPTPPVDHWHWTAYYEDGSTLQEYGPDGDHGFADVDLNHIRAFELDPVDPTSGKPAFCVLIDRFKGQRPIFFRRRAASLLGGGPSEHLMTCIGRQETIHLGCDVCGARSHEPCAADCAAGRENRAERHRNVSTYVFFDDDGHVLIADNANPLEG